MAKYSDIRIHEDEQRNVINLQQNRKCDPDVQTECGPKQRSH